MQDFVHQPFHYLGDLAIGVSGIAYQAFTRFRNEDPRGAGRPDITTVDGQNPALLYVP